MLNKPVIYVASILGGSFLLRYVSAFLSTFIGILIPAYRTLLIIQQTSGEDLDEKKNALLMYWLCYATLTGIEQFIYWIPFYGELKLTSLVLLQVPIFNKTVGYLIIYKYITNGDSISKLQKTYGIIQGYFTHSDNWLTKLKKLSGL